MKRLLRFFLYLPVLMQAQKSLGQDSTSTVAATVSPALFTPVSVAVQAGFQFRMNKRCGLVIEGAYPTFYPRDEYEKIYFWRGSVSWKFYTTRRRTGGKYYAVQAAYLHRELREDNGGVVHNKDGEYRYDAATIHSPVFSLAILAGAEINTRNRRFFADIFGGAGARRLFNRYTAKNLRLTSLDRPKESFDWLFPDEGWRFGYALTRLYLTAGVKFGVRL